MDPNWFYSSLAQSAAAIIGVIAAVAIARLQQQITALRTLARDLDSSTEQLAAVLYSLDENLAKFEEWAASARARVTSRITANTGATAIPEERSLTELVASEHIGNSDEAAKFLQRLDQRVAFIAHVRPHLASLTNPKTREAFIAANAAVKFYSAQLFNDRNDRHLLDQIILRANDVAKAATGIEAERSTRVAAFTLGLLVWLTFFGVLCPLAHLSADTELHKRITLFLFSAGVAAVPVLVLYEIVKLHQLGRYEIRIPPAPLAA